MTSVRESGDDSAYSPTTSRAVLADFQRRVDACFARHRPVGGDIPSRQDENSLPSQLSAVESVASVHMGVGLGVPIAATRLSLLPAPISTLPSCPPTRIRLMSSQSRSGLLCRPRAATMRLP